MAEIELRLWLLLWPGVPLQHLCCQGSSALSEEPVHWLVASCTRTPSTEHELLRGTSPRIHGVGCSNVGHGAVPSASCRLGVGFPVTRQQTMAAVQAGWQAARRTVQGPTRPGQARGPISWLLSFRSPRLWRCQEENSLRAGPDRHADRETDRNTERGISRKLERARRPKCKAKTSQRLQDSARANEMKQKQCGKEPALFGVHLVSSHRKRRRKCARGIATSPDSRLFSLQGTAGILFPCRCWDLLSSQPVFAPEQLMGSWSGICIVGQHRTNNSLEFLGMPAPSGRVERQRQLPLDVFDVV
mmetsp:Transcript_24868/g.54065  ORF Transcript_24868/g.54065 Transcript_24868/m.54065 type:complete len:302 (+) Transcript_24868:90-995(+)